MADGEISVKKKDISNKTLPPVLGMLPFFNIQAINEFDVHLKIIKV